MKRKCEENNTTTCSSSSSSAPLDKKQSKTDSTTQCRHPKLLNGMCLYCLKDVPLDGYVEESYGVYVLEEQVHDTALSILKERKLSLVLDLDNTLIRCEASPLPNVLADDLRGKSSYTASNGVKVNLQYFEPDGPIHRIVLRPHVNEFLAKMKTMYKISIHTMGTQSYARDVSKMFDEDAWKLFREGNIISRDTKQCNYNEGETPRKSLSALTGGPSITMIVDDTVTIWDKSLWRFIINIHPCNLE